MFLKRKIPILLVSFLLTAVSILPVGAAFIPYDGYEYNADGKTVPSTNAYEPIRTYQQDAEKKEIIFNPKDFFIDEINGEMYLVNGDNTVWITDMDFKIKSKITSLIGENGETTAFSDLGGIFVKGDTIYLCDKGAALVYLFDRQGKIDKILTKPTKEIFPQENAFIPLKVLSDNLGFTYVLAQSITNGALSYDENGQFTGFYGSNNVEVTATMLAQRFWRSFMTETQVAYTTQNIPVEYDGFDIDNENFVFTCTATTKNNSQQIRKLNPIGNNIYPPGIYGDNEIANYKSLSISTRLVDITVNKDGFIYALDQERGRVFVFDDEGYQITVFGGISNQIGTFKEPVAIDTYQNEVFVLDLMRSQITVFDLTEYGQKLYQGTILNLDGRYSEAKDIWQEVLKQNANCLTAYYGIGKAEYYTGSYQAAMKNFELAGAKEAESMAFESLRTAILRQSIGYLISTILLFVILLRVIKVVRKRKRRENE